MSIPQVPEFCHCNTGEQHAAYKRMDDFFQEVVNYIGLDNARPASMQFQIRISTYKMEDGRETEDLAHMLVYYSEKNPERVVACTTEIRTEFNRMHFDFFLNLSGIKKGENLPRT